jgi:hypothetical protein
MCRFMFGATAYTMKNVFTHELLLVNIMEEFWGRLLSGYPTFKLR